MGYSEKDVYNKQNANFNIISLKPKEYNETIKQYPKYTLEDKDAYYYRKMQQMQNQQDIYDHNRSSSMAAEKEKKIAGKNTFEIEKGKRPSYYQQGRYFLPKMLNHAD